MGKSNREKSVTTLDDILDKKYGKQGAKKREEWVQEFESFPLGVLLEEARLKRGMTQEERVHSKFSQVRVSPFPST